MVMSPQSMFLCVSRCRPVRYVASHVRINGTKTAKMDHVANATISFEIRVGKKTARRRSVTAYVQLIGRHHQNASIVDIKNVSVPVSSVITARELERRSPIKVKSKIVGLTLQRTPKLILQVMMRLMSHSPMPMFCPSSSENVCQLPLSLPKQRTS